MPTVEPIQFCSRLPAAYRAALEEILFFNPRQHLYRGSIERAIDEYGVPGIEPGPSGGTVGVTFGHARCQALYALSTRNGQPRPDLAGVLVYTRRDARTLAIVHVAVREEFTLAHSENPQPLGLALVGHLLSLGRRIQGIERLILGYSGKGERALPIRAQV